MATLAFKGRVKQMENECYGDAFGRRAGIDASPVFVNRMLTSAEVAITEAASNRPTQELTDPHPEVDAFLVAANIIEIPEYRLWENGKYVATDALLAGETEIFDLKDRPVVHFNSPIHTLHFYFPRAALNEIADSAGVARIESLRRRKDRNDYIVRNLAKTILPAMRTPDQANKLFVDQVMLAIGNHAAITYGGMRTLALSPGGLAPWQERRALEILDAHIDGDLSLDELARVCDLSTSHFSRAFRRTLGVAPHQWLLHRRVDRAKSLMLAGHSPLSEIALACGFTDQSHFTRVFSGLVGTSPGAWRRAG